MPRKEVWGKSEKQRSKNRREYFREYRKLRANYNPRKLKENVGYSALHKWVRRRLSKPKFCERCLQSPPRDLANKTGKYLRDLTDWEYLCRKCHIYGDGRLKFLELGRKPKLSTPNKNLEIM